MKNNIKPINAKVIPVSMLATIGKPRCWATHGKTKPAIDIIEAFTITLNNLYKTKTTIINAIKIKIVSTVTSITILNN